jgi:uncharacterized protein YyaL (SSP411 family)
MTWERTVALMRAVVAPRSCVCSGTLDLTTHIEETVRWILVARDHTADGGISARYDLLRGRWAPSYPETSGYTVETLLACASAFRRPDLREAGLGVADYLLQVRMAEGAVGHWNKRERQLATPVVFDTGQIIFGWLAAWRETGESAYLEAAVKAGDWLISVQDPCGAWVRFQHQGTVKVIDTRVAWALLRLAEVTSKQTYVDGAQRNLNWALHQQQANGWFGHASLLPGEDPFTHAIAYTAEGLLECGIGLNEPRYVGAAEKVARAMLNSQRADGSLASTYDAAWRPTARSTCLTGNCQMALLWLRLHGLSEGTAYLDAARRAIAFVASTQNLHTSNPNIRGAIAGSYPIYGCYVRFQYPNWAAKFFVDALLGLQAAGRSHSV